MIGLGVNNRVAGPMAKNFSKKGAVFEGLALSSILYQILIITIFLSVYKIYTSNSFKMNYMSQFIIKHMCAKRREISVLLVSFHVFFSVLVHRYVLKSLQSTAFLWNSSTSHICPLCSVIVGLCSPKFLAVLDYISSVHNL